MTSRAIPCHLIAGPLGVGKTTAILDYLRRRQDVENIAVLVNDFGPGGLDGMILREEGATPRGGLTVIPVPGGCLCCTSAVHFEIHLQRIAQDPGIDRIIIEPSGIVMLDQMKALLARLAPALGLDLQPVIVMLNLARFEPRHFTAIPYHAMLVREANVLVGNRRDGAAPERIESFHAFAGPLQSNGKRIYTAEFGRLPAEAFAAGLAVASSGTATTPPGHIEREQRRSGAREWDGETRFHHQGMIEALQAWLDAIDDPVETRFKGAFQTDQGWSLVEIAQGRLYARPFPAQDKSRAEWILSGPGTIAAPDTALAETVI